MPEWQPRLDDDALLNDPTLRRFVEMTDPARKMIVPPPRKTAAELRELVDRGRPIGEPVWRRVQAWWTGQAGRSRRFAIPAAAAVVTTLAILVGGPAALTALGGNDAPPAVPEPLRLEYAGHAPPARATLLDLVARVKALPTPMAGSRVTYVHTRSWSRDTTSSTVDIQSYEQRLWWSTDLSGRRERTFLPDDTRTATQRTPAPQIDLFTRGELSLPVDDPSTDPVILAGQLSGHQPFDQGPQNVIRAVADMYQYHTLTPAQRAAALRVLADTDGLTIGGTVTDRLGRQGTAICFDSDQGATRDIAVFDPGTGVLLSYERVALISPPRSAVRAPALIASVLYLANSHTEHIG